MIIQINEKPIEIKKMSLGKMAEFLSEIENFPKILENFKDLEKEQIISKIPELLAMASEELFALISKATGINRKEIKAEWGLDDLSVVINAILEVNNFDLIKKNLAILTEKFKSQSLTK